MIPFITSSIWASDSWSIGPPLHLILSASLAFLAIPKVSAVTATASGIRNSGMPGMWVTAMTPLIALASASSMETTDAPWVAARATTVGSAPSTFVSMAYGMVPVAIRRASSRWWGRPMILNSLELFGFAIGALGNERASSLISLYDTFSPLRAMT